MHMLSPGIWYNILCGISKFSVITNVSVLLSVYECVHCAHYHVVLMGCVQFTLRHQY